MRSSNESCDSDPPQWARSLSASVGRRYSQSGLPRQPVTLRPAAVLVLLTDGPNGLQVLLTERESTLADYPGRLSFPGGGRDKADAGPVGTALREAREEVGFARVDIPASAILLGENKVQPCR